MNKVQTINLKGNEYALVPQRLKQFRQDNPRGSVTPTPDIRPDGTVVFSVRIIKDKADPTSADATGHSYGKLTGEKAFEKLETIATGRALSLLGYLNNGEIASTEEMEEFEEYKETQFREAIANATDRQEFVNIMAGLNPEQMKIATPLINARIKELKDGKTDSGGTAE